MRSWMLFGVSLLGMVPSLFSHLEPQGRGLLLDRKMPGTYVSFGGVGPREPAFLGESGKGVRLRLHNNYRFDILVATFPLEGNRVAVVYDVYSTEGRKLEHNLGYRSEITTSFRISPGAFIEFSLPAEHLTRHQYVLIPFEIEIEKGATEGGPAPLHFAVFYGSSIPSR